MLDALGADELACEPADLIGAPPQHHDFETMMRIEVYVQGGDDLLVMRVLVLGELVGEIRGVVIVHERDRSHRLGLTDAPLLLDERIANQIADCLGTVHVSLVRDQSIEALEQALVRRDSEPYDFRHDDAPYVSSNTGTRSTNRALTPQYV